jgi:hypothetical protein
MENGALKTGSVNLIETFPSLAHPHDLLVRHVLSDPELAADFLRHYVDPGIIGQLELSRLRCEAPESIDSGLAEFQGDLPFSTCFRQGGRRAEVLVFLEHQSRADRLISFRILEYIVKSYRVHLTAGKGKGGEAGTFPYALAVVLYHGKKPWRELPRMRDLLIGVPAGVDVSGYLDYPLHLVDLAALPEGEIRGEPAVRALLSALRAHSSGGLAKRLPAIVDMLAESAGDARFPGWLQAFIHYIMSRCRPEGGLKAIRDIWRRFVNEREAEKMTATLAEELILEGLEKGRAEGRAEALRVALRKLPPEEAARLFEMPLDEVRRLTEGEAATP